MHVRHFLIAFALLAASPLASAGQIYKIVGPDGKVTFSDKPPADASTKDYEVVNGQAGAGSQTKTSPAVKQSAAATGAPTERTAPANLAANAAAGAPPDAALQSAVSGVLGTADLVRQTHSMCVNTLPASAAKYDAIVQHWTDRNGALVARARETLQTRFDATARQSIETGIRKKNEATFTPVAEAPANTRIGWCDKSFAAIEGGTMDVQNNPKFAAPLSK